MESDIGFDRHHRPLAVVLMTASKDRMTAAGWLARESYQLQSSSSPDITRMPVTILSTMSR